MANGRIRAQDAGTVVASAGADIRGGGIAAKDAPTGAGAVTSTSGGCVDGVVAHVYIGADAAGAVVTIDAATGVGSAGELETTVAAIDVDNSTSGSIDLAETNSVTVPQLDNDTAAEDDPQTGIGRLGAGGTHTV